MLAADMGINSIYGTAMYGSVTQVLISALLVTFAYFIIVYKWKRRNLEKLAAQIPGPPALPIIGNALELLGSSESESETE